MASGPTTQHETSLRDKLSRMDAEQYQPILDEHLIASSALTAMDSSKLVRVLEQVAGH